MMNDSLIDPSAINAGAHNGNSSQDHYYYDPCSFSGLNFICIFFDFTNLICIIGILLNGMVIWLLGFCIKRSPFTIFILNRTVADFGVLMAAILFRIERSSVELYILAQFSCYIFFSVFSTSQMFLTVITVDRCVSVFFPLWHQRHRPTWLSPLVCTLTWLLSLLIAITAHIYYGTGMYFSSQAIIYLLIANGFLCLPLMTISSLMLFLKVCCKSRQQRRKKLLTTILVTVAFFLFCCVPFSTFMFQSRKMSFPLPLYFSRRRCVFVYGAMSCACLNSSINPLIYYLVGRRKEGRSNKSMKGILQNLFKEEEI